MTSVIGIKLPSDDIVCFTCAFANHYTEKRLPVVGADLPYGFTCTDCSDMIQEFGDPYPTLTIECTGVVRNGDIEFTVTRSNPHTGEDLGSDNYSGWVFHDYLPPNNHEEELEDF